MIKKILNSEGIYRIIEVVLFLAAFLLPLLTFAQSTRLQWEDVAARLCSENKKGVIVFDCPDSWVGVLSAQQEMKDVVFIESKNGTDLAKSMGRSEASPAIYLLDKNMMLLHKGPGNRKGWIAVKNLIPGPTSNDCHMTATLPTGFAWDDPKPANKARVEDGPSSSPDDKPAPKEAIPVIPNLEAAVAASPKPSAPKPQAKVNPPKEEPRREATRTNPSVQTYVVQVGLYEKEENAKRKAAQDRDGMSPTIRKEYVAYLGKEAWYVDYEGFVQISDAKAFAKRHRGFVKN